MSGNTSAPRKPGRFASRRDMFSFDRAALLTLGFYEPGKTATLVDPVSTGARYPNAVLAHELMHQSLAINTTFGIFTQLINRLRSEDFAEEDAFEACHDVQWTVQEATATYTELAVVAREAPESLAHEIDALPSQSNMGAAYREAFESLASWLPLSTREDESTIRAKALLTKAIAYAAMDTDCLRRGLADAPSRQVLFDCMADTPDDRFARLMALGKAGAYSSVLDGVRRRVADSGGHTSAEFSLGIYKGIRAVSEHAVRWEDGDLQGATERLVGFWRPFLPHFKLRSVGNDDPLPAVAYGPSRAATNAGGGPQFSRLPERAAAELAAKATKHGLALIVELALHEMGVAHIKLGAYIQARQDEPWPAGDPPDEQIAKIPPDVGGLAYPETVVRELEAFPALPRVVSLLLPGGIDNLANVEGGEAFFRKSVRFYRVTDITLSDVEVAVRQSGVREFVVLGISSNVRLACILTRGGDAFVIARIGSDASLNVFLAICEKLGIGAAKDPGSLQRERDLLAMVGRF